MKDKLFNAFMSGYTVGILSGLLFLEFFEFLDKILLKP